MHLLGASGGAIQCMERFIKRLLVSLSEYPDGPEVTVQKQTESCTSMIPRNIRVFSKRKFSVGWLQDLVQTKMSSK